MRTTPEHDGQRGARLERGGEAPPCPAARPRARGLSLVELLVALAIVALLAALSVPAGQRILQGARLERLATDGAALRRAILEYSAQHGHPPWPGADAPGGLNLKTLEPLVSEGLLPGHQSLLARLKDGALTAYDTPGAPGEEGYWLVITDGSHHEVQVLVAGTKDFPLAPGERLEGLYVLRGASVGPIDKPFERPQAFMGGPR